MRPMREPDVPWEDEKPEKPKYYAASIDASVEVTAYEHADGDPRQYRDPRRTVKIGLNQVFGDDAELDAAIDAFAAAVREAARR